MKTDIPKSKELRLFTVSRITVLIFLVVLQLPQTRQFVEGHRMLRWIQAVYLILLSFSWAYILVPLLYPLSLKLGLVDKPDEVRKHHTTATPISGGLAIFIAFAITIVFNFHFSVQMKAILVGSSLIFIVGVLDDLFKLSAKIRLAAQIAASFVLIYFGVRVTFIPDSLGGVYTETLLTLIWLIGITNSMNFIDGIDGLAAGSAVIYCIFFAIVSLLSGQHYMMYLVAAVAGSSLGFFVYNFRVKKPALIFLGDSGSTFLGFFLASIAILGEWGENIADITVPVLIMSVLIFDMCLTTVIRIYTGEVRSFGEWLHYTGRDHFHHRMSDLGLGNKLAAIVIFGVSICFGLEALVVNQADITEAVILLLHTILTFIILGIVLAYKRKSIPEEGIPVEKGKDT